MIPATSSWKPQDLFAGFSSDLEKWPKSGLGEFVAQK